MTFMNDLMADLHKDEGCVLVVYDDYDGSKVIPGHIMKGHPTIGMGRALDVHGINTTEAAFLLANDCTRVYSMCQSAFTWFLPLDDVRKRAICNMAFQLGITGVTEFLSMIAAIQKQDWQLASASMLDSAWARETPARAEKIAKMIATGAEPL